MKGSPEGADAPESGDVDRAQVASRWWQHALAVLWTLALALLVLGPALRRAPMIGPYDVLATSSLTSRAGVLLHGDVLNRDPSVQMIPWTSLSWNQVHHGVLPLWNSYNGLGLPFAFNWQSAVFSVPALVGYLVPLRDAYTTGVIVTLCIAGTGGYVLGRVLRLRMLAALTVASVFELSGPLIAWLGYPQTQVMAWGGWLFAAALLVVRGERRAPSIALFAVVTACAIYSGHPETLIVMMSATLLLVVALLISRALPARLGLPDGPVLRPAVDQLVALVAGAALGAPLLLPGLQLTSSSIRATSASGPPPPLHDTLYLLFQGFDGLPVPGNYAFGASFFYNEVAAYVGVIALVLASLGIVIAVITRRPQVLAIVFAGAVMALTAYAGPVARLVDALPFLGQVNWLRALMPLSLAVAALAGVGVDALLRPRDVPIARKWLFGAFSVAALCLAALWLVGRGGGLPSFGTTLAEHVRAQSFVWPVVGTGLGLVVSALLLWRPRWRTAGATVLVVGEVVALLSAGSILIASSSNGFPATAAVTTLARLVGGARVGVGQNSGCNMGITADANIFYGVRELDLYDPIVPKAYFSQWQRETHTSAGSSDFDEFCPDITTTAQARQFGVSYVLEPSGTPGPPGTRFVARLSVPDPYSDNPLAKPPSNEDVYYVPDSSMATLSAPSGRARHAGLVTVQRSGSNPAHVDLVTHDTQPGVLQVRVTDVPGWHATIDGRPLALEGSSVFGLRARIPAGTHRIQLRYWPSLFTVGLVVALLAVLGLGLAVVLDQRHRRRQGRPDPRDAAVRRETEPDDALAEPVAPADDSRPVPVTNT